MRVRVEDAAWRAMDGAYDEDEARPVRVRVARIIRGRGMGWCVWRVRQGDGS